MPKICWCGNSGLTYYSEEYLKCDACKTLVSKKEFDDSIYHVQDEEHDLYGENYWKKGMLEQAGVNSLEELTDLYLGHRAAYWMGFLLQYVCSIGKVAEIGGGLGQFSYLLKKAGFDQTNFEMSPEICRYGRETFGIHTVCGDIGDTNDEYDAIVAFDLIEHILDVDSFTARVASHLREVGVLCLQTPCYDDKMSYEVMLRSKPEFNLLLQPNEHIFLFSRSSIQKLLGKHGFSYIQFEPAVFGDHYDMFLFAGKKPLVKRGPEEIRNLPLDKGSGYLVRAISRAVCEYQKKFKLINAESIKRLDDVNILTKAISERDGKLADCQQQLEFVNAESIKRLDDVNALTKAISERDGKLADCQQQLEFVNAESIKRLDDVNALTKAISERDGKLAKCQQQLEFVNAESIKRLEDVNVLTRIIGEKDELLNQCQKQIIVLQDVTSRDKQFVRKLETEKAGLETQKSFRLLRSLKMIK